MYRHTEKCLMEAWGSVLMRSDLYIRVLENKNWFLTMYVIFMILMVLLGGFCILFSSCWVDRQPRHEGLNQTASPSLSLFIVKISFFYTQKTRKYVSST